MQEAFTLNSLFYNQKSKECGDSNFSEEFKIFYYILYTVQAVASMSAMFLKWVDLSPHESIILNNIMRNTFNEKLINCYQPILQAFKKWAEIQDIDGATGFTKIPYEIKLLEKTEKVIKRILVIMDASINQIKLKGKLLTVIGKYQKSK